VVTLYSAWFTFVFSPHKIYALPAECISEVYMDLRTNGDYFPIQHYLIGFCNLEEVYLLSGMD